MPKSKRATVVSLTKTKKKGREHKESLMDQVRADADAFQYVWVFHIENKRNNLVNEVREQWKGSRLRFGRTGVLRKALGNSPEEEYRPGLHHIARQVEGDVGLLFTNEPVQTVIDWAATYSSVDYARSGNVAPTTFEVPEGPIMIGGAIASHTLEPQFRKLGMVTTLAKGVPTLGAPHVVCREGDVLTPPQIQLLKLFGQQLSKFRIVLKAAVQVSDGMQVYTA